MALGTVTTRGNWHDIELLASATATNSPPSGASAGVSVQDTAPDGPPRRGMLCVKSTAGSATMDVTLRLWGYVDGGPGGYWAPIGTGDGSTKGFANGGLAINETEADTIQHVELIEHMDLFDRLYCEITAISGTATAVTVWIRWAKETS